MKKDALLDAAESVLFEQGTQALTLAAVADRAGVSKEGCSTTSPRRRRSSRRWSPGSSRSSTT
ncbi:TetR family transcriptional regulator [Actinomadura yumaensis]|uniref:TetR family transcriptional regulator n=1 Tax=Actinomadura yumaensis TaxID=111807 RepID=UPI003606C4E9